MTKRKTLKNRADKLFSEYIRLEGECEWCLKKASGRYLHCAHINSRRFLVTRWNPLNAVALCPGCHRKAHDRPTFFTEWLKEHLGDEAYDELKYEAKNSTEKVDLEDTIGKLQMYLNPPIRDWKCYECKEPIRKSVAFKEIKGKYREVCMRCKG